MLVVNVAPGDPIGGGGRRRAGLAALEAIDEVAIVAAPGYTDALSYEDVLGTASGPATGWPSSTRRPSSPTSTR